MRIAARRLARRAALIAAAGLLVACAATSPTDSTGLRPLPSQIAVPAGAPPRSKVASVLYDLAGSAEAPDDGVPGDEGPRPIFERGGASWYGIQFHQRKTANGERFDMTAKTAAHKTLPFNTRVCVRSLVNGREVLVRINDRGPYAAGRVIDLSRSAAEAIGMLDMGIKQVALSIADKDNASCNGVAVGPAETPPDTRAAPAPRPTREASPRQVPPRQRR
jgi:rare lipoprotein A